MEEAKKAVPELPGLVEGQAPSVGFDPGESWMEFSLNLTVKRFVDQYGVRTRCGSASSRGSPGKGSRSRSPRGPSM